MLQGAKRGTFANAGIFQVPTVDLGGTACESTNRPTLMRLAQKPKRRRALELQSGENRQKLLQLAKRGTFADAGIFQVPSVDSGGMACESTNGLTLMRLAPNPSSRGKTAKRCSREQNEALLLTLVFSRFQQWIWVERPAKAPTDRL